MKTTNKIYSTAFETSMKLDFLPNNTDENTNRMINEVHQTKSNIQSIQPTQKGIQRKKFFGPKD